VGCSPVCAAGHGRETPSSSSDPSSTCTTATSAAPHHTSHHDDAIGSVQALAEGGRWRAWVLLESPPRPPPESLVAVPAAASRELSPRLPETLGERGACKWIRVGDGWMDEVGYQLPGRARGEVNGRAGAGWVSGLASCADLGAWV
jgi:hypothetical protein